MTHYKLTMHRGLEGNTMYPFAWAVTGDDLDDMLGEAKDRLEHGFGVTIEVVRRQPNPQPV